VHLVRGYLTMRIVTHELLHALFVWARRKRFDFMQLSDIGSESSAVTDDEERITYAYSRLTNDFMARACTLGLYGTEWRIDS
jgi:hypothetical protein